jgi:hypothetical protein
MCDQGNAVNTMLNFPCVTLSYIYIYIYIIEFD